MKENNIDSASELTRKYTLSFDEPTKTELSGTGSTRQVNWTGGEEIMYYTEPKQSSAASTSVVMNGGNAFIQIPNGRSDEFINVVYGATSIKSSTSTADCMYVSSPVKNEQSYTSFAEAHLCAAFLSDIEESSIRFHNAAAILSFTSVASVYKVVVSGNKKEIITGGNNGDLTITYNGSVVATQPTSSGGFSVSVPTNGSESKFYIAILPITFKNGITVECFDANDELLAQKKTTSEIKTVSDSGGLKIINLGNAQDWIPETLPLAVDLGLSVKWARYNLGATEPEQYGDYYAWGETAPKNEYKWTNYAYEQGSGKNGPFSKYVLNSEYGAIDHKSVLDLSDDAAHAAWGDDWRMPSQEEFQELMNNCNWQWTTRNGVNGYRVTSKKSGYTGNSIFLPANGMYSGSTASDVGTIGNYWSASASDVNTYHAISPYFSSSYVKSGNCYRYFGLGVRPVQGAVVPVSSIDVSPTLEIVVGKTATLSASVQPANATYKNVTCASSDESIATVYAAGKVTAVSIGKATITVYSANAATTATCEVTVVEPPKPQAVDLGLPSGLKWASWNVGASAPEEYGDYFAWGETKPKDNYNWSTYKWCNGNYNMLTKYCTDSSYWDSSDPMDNKTVLDPEDDAASANWGGSWRMPTLFEQQELHANCTWTWTTQNGVKGRLVTSKTNSNSIFLPAAGSRYGTSISDVGSRGYYWSSSLDMGTPYYACCARFLSYDVYWYLYDHCYGFSVRPVSE